MGTSIDVGAAASDRNNFFDPVTCVAVANPANATGLITQVQIFSDSELEGIEVASFSASGNDLTTRASVSLHDSDAGLTTYTAPTDFSPFEIRIGDYIGIYFSTGRISIDDAGVGGSGVWFKAGDQIPCTSEGFSFAINYELSLYATGYQLGQINIGDVHKVNQNILINVGESWKQIVPGSGINIGDVWKDILH